MRESKCDSVIKRRLSCPKSEFDFATSLDVKASSILSRCRICLSSILDPAALTCGHRFCEKCLYQYWHIREKPDYIICPLCRSCAYNVDFVKQKEGASTDDFRKMFTEMQNITDSDINNALIKIIKFSVIIPALYYLVKWLRIPVINLFTNLHGQLTHSTPKI